MSYYRHSAMYIECEIKYTSARQTYFYNCASMRNNAMEHIIRYKTGVNLLEMILLDIPILYY